METRIVGTQYHPGAQTRMNKLCCGDLVTLERQPDNQFDPNAVAVKHGGQMLGYIPRQSAVYIAKDLDRGAALRAIITRASGPDILIEEVRLKLHSDPQEEDLPEVELAIDPRTGEVHMYEPAVPDVGDGDNTPF